MIFSYQFRSEHNSWFDFQTHNFELLLGFLFLVMFRHPNKLHHWKVITNLSEAPLTARYEMLISKIIKACKITSSNYCLIRCKDGIRRTHETALWRICLKLLICFTSFITCLYQKRKGKKYSILLNKECLSNLECNWWSTCILDPYSTRHLFARFIYLSPTLCHEN